MEPSSRRYGIYALPPPNDEWTEFATAWLGWDINQGVEVPQPLLDGLPLPLSETTQRPRKYGLHATIKPPFSLADGTDAQALERTLETFASRRAPVQIARLAVTRLGRFIALCPRETSTPLTSLAADCVRTLDRFRAPPDAAELARRRKHRLSKAQEANLTRWGYPHVMDQFRFHLTLSNPLQDPLLRQVEAVLDQHLRPLLPRVWLLSDLALVGEAADGRFHLVRRVPLSG